MGGFRREVPAPEIGIGRGQQFGTQALQFLVQLQLGAGSPVQAGHAVVHMFGAEVHATVAFDANAEDEFLTCGFAQLHLDWPGLRAACFSQGDQYRVVVAAADQALLGFEQVALLVGLARAQASQALHHLGVVMLGAFDVQCAQKNLWSGVQYQHQGGAVALGVNVGSGFLPSGLREVLGTDRTQQLVFGLVPGFLCEGPPSRQPPAFAQLVAYGLKGCT